MTIEDIKALAWPTVILVGAILTYITIRRGGVSSISASKDGLVIGMTPVDTRANYQHAMDKRIAAADDQLYRDAKRATKAARRAMELAVNGHGLCASSRESVASKMLDPLFDAVDDNDFKTHLATANREAYLEDKLSLIRERYDEARADAAAWCQADGADQSLLPWEDVEAKVSEALARWGDQVASAVTRACTAKVEVYTECRPQFEAAKDEYMVKVIDTKMAANRGYAAAIVGPAA